MMSRISLTAGSFLLMASVLGCMHKGSNNSASKAISGYDDSDQDLTADVGSRPLPVDEAENPAESGEQPQEEAEMGSCEAEFAQTNCIMMYEPVSCISGTFIVDGGNRCDATKKAKMQACQTKSNFDEAKLECFAGEKSESCSAAKENCTRERIDTLCSVKDPSSGENVAAFGANACLARKNLAKMFCLRDSEVDVSTFDCKSIVAKK